MKYPPHSIETMYWRKRIILPLLISILFTGIVSGQHVSSSLPSKIETASRYLFYQHGAIVTVLGDNAVQQSYPEWGPYQYSKILDSLSSFGFHVISERRLKDVDDSVYVNKIAMQVDSLLKSGVQTKNILLIGASAGWSIILRASHQIRNPNLRYVIIGGCWPDTYKEFETIKLYGHYFSIIESSDPHGTCSKIYENHKTMSSFGEITLNTGLSHGFFNRPRKAWIDPILLWFNQKE